MSEPKAKTLQERFGFADPDLKTPKHDAIMMWLDAEMGNILAGIVSEPEWRIEPSFTYSRQLDEREQRAEAHREALALRLQIISEVGAPEKPELFIRKIWEDPIQEVTFYNGRRKAYTIGFCDMMVLWRQPFIECLFDVEPKFVDGLWRPVWSYKGSRIRKPDHSLESDTAYFEVKPSIPSAGELIRQLRMYQAYTGNAKWFVVSPDDRFRSIVESQGFGFIQVPPEV